MGIASANNVDFMIKGVFKFQAFGQELWVTTTEIGLSIDHCHIADRNRNQCQDEESDGSTGYISEYHGIRCRDA